VSWVNCWVKEDVIDLAKGILTENAILIRLPRVSLRVFGSLVFATLFPVNIMRTTVKGSHVAKCAAKEHLVFREYVRPHFH
jgi:hypothetical protein